MFTFREHVIFMNDNQIIVTTLNILAKNAGLTAQFHPKLQFGKEGYDGELHFVLPQQLPIFKTDIKKEIRQYQIPQLIEKAAQHPPYMVIAATIFPLVKEALRAHKINYADAAGNIYLHYDNQMIWIDGHKPALPKKTASNRAFTRTGLKALFYLLQHQNAINGPYRKLAEAAGVAVGNIKNIIDGLREAGFILQVTDKQLALQNKRELLERWVVGYGEILRPALFLQAYHFFDKKKLAHWQDLNFDKNEMAWGGEPGADLLTHYLKPETLLLYTPKKNTLAADWTLIPNEQGVLTTYEKFWKDEPTDPMGYAPPLLLYADLLLTHDPRCLDTANIIYENYLKNEFE